MAIAGRARRREQGGSWRDVVLWIAAGVVTMAVLITALFATGTAILRRTEPYRLTSELVSASPVLREAVGDGAHLGYFFVSGSVKTSTDGSGQAVLAGPVRGDRGSTEIRVAWRRSGGTWRLAAADYRDSSGERREFGGVEKTRAAMPAETEAAEDPVSVGHRLFNANDFAGARAAYDRAIERAPGDPEIWYWRGLAALRAGDEEQALSDLRRSLELDPARFDACLQADWILSRRAAWDDIIALWTGLIERDPGNGRAYLERGGASVHKGDRGSAVRDAEQACRLGVEEGCRLAARYGPAAN